MDNNDLCVATQISLSIRSLNVAIRVICENYVNCVKKCFSRRIEMSLQTILHASE
jgi:hypothetical protein